MTTDEELPAWYLAVQQRARDEASTAPTATVQATQYVVSCLPEGHINRHRFTINVTYRGDGAWAVIDSSHCLSSTGTWDYEHVPFFFKQWGEYGPTGYLVIGGTSKGTLLAGDPVDNMGHRVELARLGKKAAGRELDGRTWDQFPART
ncbi:DUF5131 family protein [Streptomyces sp. 8L]|uniref:DUF5131 family protein n=1 Tax=Streptomyces sp. 8L TaxID=2877242 RepID=UPI001CD724A0|nr:DUF5131 family protein [Streptomyces sp. 8L]MCA1224037.1 phage Gp37/Gp68 family protein [Streptomyces sp. 8L]